MEDWAKITDEELPMQLFNLTVGLIFHRLLLDFPIRQSVRPGNLGEKFEACIETPTEDKSLPNGRLQEAGIPVMMRSNIPTDQYVDSVCDWLVREGFLSRNRTDIGVENYQLSLKTLDILESRPSGIKSSLGSELSGAAKQAGSEAGRAAISEIVGQVIGAAARGFMGGGA